MFLISKIKGSTLLKMHFHKAFFQKQVLEEVFFVSNIPTPKDYCLNPNIVKMVLKVLHTDI